VSAKFAVQAEIPNHRKLRRLSGVVSVAIEVPRVAGQVCDEKTNVCEPLLTHRKKQRRHRPSAPDGRERPACGLGGARCLATAATSDDPSGIARYEPPTHQFNDDEEDRYAGTRRSSSTVTKR
jgi:hypothetical protein